MIVKFIPTKFARQAFNLQAAEYCGPGVTEVLNKGLV